MPDIHIKLYPNYVRVSPVCRLRHAQGTLEWMSHEWKGLCVTIDSIPAHQIPSRLSPRTFPYVIPSSLDSKAEFSFLFLERVRKEEISSQWYNQQADVSPPCNARTSYPLRQTTPVCLSPRQRRQWPNVKTWWEFGFRTRLCKQGSALDFCPCAEKPQWDLKACSLSPLDVCSALTVGTTLATTQGLVMGQGLTMF